MILGYGIIAVPTGIVSFELARYGFHCRAQVRSVRSTVSRPRCPVLQAVWRIFER